jgi:hypothetical protein
MSLERVKEKLNIELGKYLYVGTWCLTFASPGEKGFQRARRLRDYINKLDLNKLDDQISLQAAICAISYTSSSILEHWTKDLITDEDRAYIKKYHEKLTKALAKYFDGGKLTHDVIGKTDEIELNIMRTKNVGAGY